MISKRTNIKLAFPDSCTGCGACVQSCAKGAISMVEDREGFLQPRIDTKLCIECHKCEQVCPILNPIAIPQDFETTAYAAINKDEDVRMRSSSGGVFYALAKWTIEQEGVVFGARWDENWEVKHDFTETIEGVEPFMRSKYVQSRVGDTYKQTKEFLKQGRWVLYSGTPCQIAGLHSFLGKDYDKLILVDLICHGVPSPGVWRKCLHTYANHIHIKNISFRDKSHGWEHGYVISITKDSANTIWREECWSNPYYSGFLHNILLRRSCYECQFRKYHRDSDITLADYLGVEETCKEMSDGKGTSIIFVHSSKGMDLIDKNISLLKVCEQERHFVIESGHNFVMIKNPDMPLRRRYFFQTYRFLPYKWAKRFLLRDPYYVRIIRKIKQCLK